MDVRGRRAVVPMLALALVAAAITQGAIDGDAALINNDGAGGCGWTTPIVRDFTNQGCDYIAASTQGEVVWVGATPATISGASSTPACVITGTVNECDYSQVIGAVISVEVQGSDGGVAGTPEPGLGVDAALGNTCVWTAPSWSCTVQMSIGPLVQPQPGVSSTEQRAGAGVVSWVTGPMPQISITGANSSVSCTPTTGAGGCAIQLFGSPLLPTTVTITVTGTPGSTGAVSIWGLGDNCLTTCPT